MLHVLQIEGKTLHQQKDYDLLYCDSSFLAGVWNQTHSIFEVCLYVVWCWDLPLFFCTCLSSHPGTSCWNACWGPRGINCLSTFAKGPWFLLNYFILFYFLTWRCCWKAHLFSFIAGFLFSLCCVPLYLSQQYWVMAVSDVLQSFLVRVPASHTTLLGGGQCQSFSFWGKGVTQKWNNLPKFT